MRRWSEGPDRRPPRARFAIVTYRHPLGHLAPCEQGDARQHAPLGRAPVMAAQVQLTRPGGIHSVVPTASVSLRDPRHISLRKPPLCIQMCRAIGLKTDLVEGLCIDESHGGETVEPANVTPQPVDLK